MLGLLVAVAIALGVILVVILWTPIDVDIAAKRDPSLEVKVRVAWLFGLVTTEIEPGDEKPAPPPDASAARRGGSGRSSKKVLKIIRSRGLLAGVVRLLRRLVNGIEIRRAELAARAGFDDPADTGRLLGILYPVTEWLRSRFPVDLEPDFREAVLWFDARTVVRIVPARVIGPLVVFALSPATLRAALAGARS